MTTPQSQCTNLKPSKKLKDLGYPQESYFNHVRLSDKPDGTQDWYLLDRKPTGSEEIISAPTVAELGEKLLDNLDTGEATYYLEISKNSNFWHVCYTSNLDGQLVHFEDTSLSNNLAEMLCYLLENKLIEL